MPRTDPNGRELQVVISYQLGRTVAATELHRALGVARNTYAHRCVQDDFPNAEECRLVSEHFGLNFFTLILTFGLASETQFAEAVSLLDPEGKSLGGSAKVAAKARTRRRKYNLATLPPREGLPPL